MKQSPDAPATLVRARAAWVQGRELRQDCALLLREGVVEAILSEGVAAQFAADHEYRVLSCDLVLPGFINSHCHLEYTALQGQLPRGKVPFGQWIDTILELRLSQGYADPAAAVLHGARQLAAGGCTCVVDSLSNPDVLAAYGQVNLRHLVLHEVLGLTDARADAILDQAEQALKTALESPLALGQGINPHAPYSVARHLRRRLHGVLYAHPEIACAWHLAETPDEAELLSDGSGSIGDFLRSHGLPVQESNLIPESPQSPPVQYLEQAGLLERCDLAFHGNHLSDADLALFEAPRAVVHCPGTQVFFERESFPMQRYLRAGVNVCLGTDSLASADTLSMLEVLRLTAKLYPYLGGAQLLDLVTRNPAQTRPLVTCPHRLGILAPRAAADLALFNTPGATTANLREMLLASETILHSTLVAGEIAYTA